ncbi:MAG: 2-amino-4-hydroxy-6-hydroxymethyldihydropteridine diphosphokinase [Nitrospinota bacterium]
MEAFIGVGSNLSGPRERCAEAVGRLRKTRGIRVLACSPWYLTAPVGPPDQPDFVNGVVRLETVLDPSGLLCALKAIEDAMGRAGGPRWGPRVIDLDLLLFGDLVREEGGLTIPHPEMGRRRFVLAPLCDLAPELVHPVLGKTFGEMLKDLGEGQKVCPLPE